MYLSRHLASLLLSLGLVFAGTAMAASQIHSQHAAGAIVNMEITHVSKLRSACPVLEPEGGREFHVVFLFMDAGTRRAIQPKQASIRVLDASGKVLYAADLEQVQAFGVTSFCQFIARDPARSFQIEVSFVYGKSKGKAIFDVAAEPGSD